MPIIYTSVHIYPLKKCGCTALKRTCYNGVSDGHMKMHFNAFMHKMHLKMHSMHKCILCAPMHRMHTRNSYAYLLGITEIAERSSRFRRTKPELSSKPISAQLLLRIRRCHMDFSSRSGPYFSEHNHVVYRQSCAQSQRHTGRSVRLLLIYMLKGHFRPLANQRNTA